MTSSVSAGFAYQKVRGGNLFALGLNWGEPNEFIWGADRRNQKLMEVFYRLQVTQAFALTPDVQYIQDPALADEQNSNWLVGLRARFAL